MPTVPPNNPSDDPNAVPNTPQGSTGATGTAAPQNVQPEPNSAATSPGQPSSGKRGWRPRPRLLFHRRHAHGAAQAPNGTATTIRAANVKPMFTLCWCGLIGLSGWWLLTMLQWVILKHTMFIDPSVLRNYPLLRLALPGGLETLEAANDPAAPYVRITLLLNDMLPISPVNVVISSIWAGTYVIMLIVLLVMSMRTIGTLLVGSYKGHYPNPEDRRAVRWQLYWPTLAAFTLGVAAIFVGLNGLAQLPLLPLTLLTAGTWWGVLGACVPLAVIGMMFFGYHKARIRVQPARMWQLRLLGALVFVATLTLTVHNGLGATPYLHVSPQPFVFAFFVLVLLFTWFFLPTYAQRLIMIPLAWRAKRARYDSMSDALVYEWGVRTDAAVDIELPNAAFTGGTVKAVAFDRLHRSFEPDIVAVLWQKNAAMSSVPTASTANTPTTPYHALFIEHPKLHAQPEQAISSDKSLSIDPPFVQLDREIAAASLKIKDDTCIFVVGWKREEYVDTTKYSLKVEYNPDYWCVVLPESGNLKDDKDNKYNPVSVTGNECFGLDRDGCISISRFDGSVFEVSFFPEKEKNREKPKYTYTVQTGDPDRVVEKDQFLFYGEKDSGYVLAKDEKNLRAHFYHPTPNEKIIHIPQVPVITRSRPKKEIGKYQIECLNAIESRVIGVTTIQSTKHISIWPFTASTWEK